MAFLKAVVLSVVVFSTWGAASAATAPSQVDRDIEHLLTFIERSDCTFIRNGSREKSAKAASHMRMKYKHAKGKVRTAEDFIEHAASKSSQSGKPYFVQCGQSAQQPSATWLTAELSRYRQSAAAK